MFSENTKVSKSLIKCVVLIWIISVIFYYGKFNFKYYETRINSIFKNQNFKRVADMQFEKEDMVKKYAREFVVNKFLLQLDLNELLQKINIEMLKY